MSLASSVASSLDDLPIDLGDLPQMIQFECNETCAWFEVFAGMSGRGDQKLVAAGGEDIGRFAI